MRHPKHLSHVKGNRSAALPVISLSMLALALAFTLEFTMDANAQTSVSLGTAGSYAVLAGSTVTNTGSSVITGTGDLGLSPGTSVTGFPPGTVGGTQNVANAAAVTAQTDLTTAYNQAAGEGPISPTSAATLGSGQTLTPGVYNSASTIDLTGALTLNGGGNSSAVFIFQAGSALNVASSASVVLTNGAQAGCVFWQVTSSATLGTTATFAGTVLALTSITADTGATVDGRLLARNGAVTLDDNTITVPTACTAAAAATTTTTKSTTATVPSPKSTTTSTTTKSTTTTVPSTKSTTTTVPTATKSPTVPTPLPVTG